MSDSIRAYHFVGAALRDGRPVPPDGEWLVHEGPVVICRSGLHASRHSFDALRYAPGATLCLVECRDIATEHDDKLACRARRIVARLDATAMLRAFARACAADVLHLWDAPDVVRRYLATGDESIRVAAHAAAVDAYAAAAAYAATAYAIADDAVAAAYAATADAAAAAYAAAEAEAAAYAVAYAAAEPAQASFRAAYAYAAAANAAAAYADTDAARAAQRARFAALVDDAFAEVTR